MTRIDPAITESITRNFDAYFRFQIGDLVLLKEHVEGFRLDVEINGPRASYERVAVPYGMAVLERRLQQCHGGVQGHYSIRRRTEAGDVLAYYMEDELAAWADIEPVLRKMVPEKKA